MKGIIHSLEKVEHLRKLFLSVETKMENCQITVSCFPEIELRPYVCPHSEHDLISKCFFK